MACSLPGSSVHGISQARILEWVDIPFSRWSSWPRDQTHVSCIGRWILYHLSHQGSPTLKSISLFWLWTNLLPTHDFVTCKTGCANIGSLPLSWCAVRHSSFTPGRKNSPFSFSPLTSGYRNIWGVFSYQAVPRHHLGVLQFNLLLTLSAWG